MSFQVRSISRWMLSASDAFRRVRRVRSSIRAVRQIDNARRRVRSE